MPRLRVGWSRQDITPDRPVELQGQYYQRVSRGVRDPLFATALALESADATGARAQAIMVSLDLLYVDRVTLKEVRSRLQRMLPDFNTAMLILNAIHTHNAPSSIRTFDWWTPDPNCVSSETYRPFLLNQIVQAASDAWRKRRAGGISHTLGHATAGHCRRAMYADGSAEMYGRTDRADFIGMEAGEDSGVDMLFCWDRRKKLTGIVVNLACPAQVMEATYVVTADYVGDLRRELKERLSDDVFVLVQIAPAGDQSPRDLARNYRGEPDMWNEAGAREISRRIADAVEEALTCVSENIEYAPIFQHTASNLRLPLRRASPAEYRAACRTVKALQGDEPEDAASPRSAFNRFVAQVHSNERKDGPGPHDSKLHPFVILRNNEAVTARYKTQDLEPSVPVELHALRLGDVAFATNPFELYLDYGQRIKARSPAEQTFLIQLSGDSLGYLPTSRAVAAGGYGSLIINGKVGPDGGEILVKRTLTALHRLWKR